MPCIILEDLVCGRNGDALAGPIDLVLEPSEALEIVGPNGAGKSTLLRTLAGLLPPLGGRIRVEGATAVDGEAADHLHEAAHFVGHRNALRGAETLLANLRFHARFLQASGDRIDTALECFGLADLAHLRLSHLSAGQQRRAALARLLVAPRGVWLLDEPTAALDALSQARFAAICLKHLAAGGLVVAATHAPLGIEARRLDLGEPALRSVATAGAFA